jgi:23S rRNA (pseudouridine1915-N3)-methyltransferase
MKVQVLYLDKLKFDAEKTLAKKYLDRIESSGRKIIDPIILKQINHKEMDQELNSSSFNVLLDEKGKHLSTLKFTELVFESSHKKINFFIGNTDGFTEILKKKGNLLLSISPMTLTHSFATIILLEQLYRAITIKTNHPYHKA